MPRNGQWVTYEGKIGLWAEVFVPGKKGRFMGFHMVNEKGETTLELPVAPNAVKEVTNMSLVPDCRKVGVPENYNPATKTLNGTSEETSR